MGSDGEALWYALHSDFVVLCYQDERGHAPNPLLDELPR